MRQYIYNTRLGTLLYDDANYEPLGRVLMLTGVNVTIEDMMNCRERREKVQNDFLRKYDCPIISFCLNIPGPVKTNPDIASLFFQGKEEIGKSLSEKNIKILDSCEFHEITGDELIICANQKAPFLKSLMTDIEEARPENRLFDIDVIDTNGAKLSRASYRKCLICDCQAQVCARSRKHSVPEMQKKVEELLLQQAHNFLL